MANAASLFSQLLRHFPRTEFAFLVKKHGAERHAKGFACWDQFIAMLLLKWLHHLSKAGWPLSNLVAMLRMNLFTYRDLKAWLDQPLETPPAIPMAEQLMLSLPGLGQPLVTAAQEASTQNSAVRGTGAL